MRTDRCAYSNALTFQVAWRTLGELGKLGHHPVEFGCVHRQRHQLGGDLEVIIRAVGHLDLAHRVFRRVQPLVQHLPDLGGVQCIGGDDDLVIRFG